MHIRPDEEFWKIIQSNQIPDIIKYDIKTHFNKQVKKYIIKNYDLKNIPKIPDSDIS